MTRSASVMIRVSKSFHDWLKRGAQENGQTIYGRLKWLSKYKGK